MGNKRKTVTMTIPIEGMSGVYSETVSAEEFYHRLSDALDKVPEAFCSSAKIELLAESPYEHSYQASLSVEYTRPETDEEMAERLARQKNYIDRQIAEEQRVYALLKQKYG